MKYFLTIVLTALVVGFGVVAYYQGWLPNVSFQKPQAVSIKNGESSDLPVETPQPVLPTASASAAPQDSQALIAAIKIAMVAKHGSDFSDLNYSLSKTEGDYASGMVNGTGGGGLWFAAKVNGNWSIVSDGNGVTMCSDLVPYPNFPKDMIPECWDTVTNKLVTR